MRRDEELILRKVFGTDIPGKTREDDRKLDGNMQSSETWKITGFRASGEGGRAKWNRKYISHTGDPISSRPT